MWNHLTVARVILALGQGVMCLCSARAEVHAAEPAKVELHVLETMTLTDEQFLAGVRDGQPARISAALRIPSPGTERVPAVVLLHGSGGILAGIERWARELNDLGIATLQVDSFTGRGIVDTATDQSQLGTLTMMYDAYRALELLVRHPRIDPQRIGVLGGSRGGVPALYSSLKRFQRVYSTPDAAFGVHLVFYTNCNTRYVGDTDVVDRPIHLFHGSADDVAPLGPCRSYVERLRQAGRDVQLHEYSGAHHGFDSPNLTGPTRLEGGETPGFCELLEDDAGRIVSRSTGRLFTYSDPCVRRGVTVGANSDARVAALADITAALRRIFRLDSNR